MNQTNTLYEIHVHGDVPLREDVVPKQIEEALEPLWRFAGATSLKEGAASYYQEEIGLTFDPQDGVLRMCWTVQGDESFDLVAQELCQGLNDIAKEGAPIEVSYFDSDDEGEEDSFQLLFVGPTPHAIIKAQRDLLIKDMIEMMERHFDAAELEGVVSEVDRLFHAREEQLERSLLPIKTLWSGIAFGAVHESSKRHLH